MQQYCVYIVANKFNAVLHIGVTSNLVKIIYEHKNKSIDGFTKRYNLSKLVYFEQTEMERFIQFFIRCWNRFSMITKFKRPKRLLFLRLFGVTSFRLNYWNSLQIKLFDNGTKHNIHFNTMTFWYFSCTIFCYAPAYTGNFFFLNHVLQCSSKISFYAVWE